MGSFSGISVRLTSSSDRSSSSNTTVKIAPGGVLSHIVVSGGSTRHNVTQMRTRRLRNDRICNNSRSISTDIRTSNAMVEEIRRQVLKTLIDMLPFSMTYQVPIIKWCFIFNLQSRPYRPKAFILRFEACENTLRSSSKDVVKMDKASTAIRCRSGMRSSTSLRSIAEFKG